MKNIYKILGEGSIQKERYYCFFFAFQCHIFSLLYKEVREFCVPDTVLSFIAFVCHSVKKVAFYLKLFKALIFLTSPLQILFAVFLSTYIF